MKKRIRFFTVLVAFAVWLFMLVAALSLVRSAGAQGLNYAQINAGGATLYRRSGEVYTPLTTLPATYFVCITGAESNGYLPVGYLDLDGYVPVESVTVVDFEPLYKYAGEAALTLVSDGHTVNLRAKPDHTADNVVLRLPQAAALHYYGSVEGTAQVPALGTEWFYVRYEAGGTLYRGYVYTLYASPSIIPSNVVERVPPPAPVPGPETGQALPDEDPFRAGSAVSIIVIVCMCVPAAAALIFLYRNEGNRKKPLNGS